MRVLWEINVTTSCFSLFVVSHDTMWLKYWVDPVTVIFCFASNARPSCPLFLSLAFISLSICSLDFQVISSLFLLSIRSLRLHNLPLSDERKQSYTTNRARGGGSKKKREKAWVNSFFPLVILSACQTSVKVTASHTLCTKRKRGTNQPCDLCTGSLLRLLLLLLCTC